MRSSQAVREGQEPGRGAAAGPVEPLGLLPGLHEDFLQHFLALRLVLEQAPDQSKDPWSEAVVELLEGALVAVGNTAHEFFG